MSHIIYIQVEQEFALHHSHMLETHTYTCKTMLLPPSSFRLTQQEKGDVTEKSDHLPWLTKPGRITPNMSDVESDGRNES